MRTTLNINFNRKKIVQHFIFSTIVVGLVGCQALSNEWNPRQEPTLVKQGHFSSAYQYTVPVGWRILPNTGKTKLTIDAPLLNQISVTDADYDEKGFTTCLVGKNAKDTITPIDLQQTYEACFIASNGNVIKPKHSIELTQINGLDGIKVNTTYASKALSTIQLKRNSYVLIDNKNERLIYATYFAPAEYYFDRNIADFEALVQSMKFKMFEQSKK